MNKKVEKLRKKIIQYSPEKLKETGVPDVEAEYLGNYMLIPMDLLQPLEWNYKQEDQDMSQKLRANMSRIGQVENIHVRELSNGYFEVINGDHRHVELVKMGKQFVAAYNHGDIPYHEAVRRALETNETKWQPNHFKLSNLIEELVQEVDIPQLEITLPYDQNEIDSMVETARKQFDRPGAGETTPDDSDPTHKTVSFTIPRTVYEDWLAARKKIDPDKAIERKHIFRFMVDLTASVTPRQIKAFHKSLE